ncbi:Sugar kinase of the NBD/HSP70 family, may contain an N-terminal HTH domain [Paraoerskovia marina]|uniref:Sugar kinase of the NBD/HSP70 family, may contain an N-terminal HTH domain n=1 Tax=Paraoerskovia marina TaxID=545619 RepID=A0A1H1RAA3_9CELL|nr:ROK family protein [Paraoerskovia marina]SDS32651.1 Sugar kinase of the NBD/HSP70 family, may contain an N-terminal HTH domain [Paraoerskovia marina]
MEGLKKFPPRPTGAGEMFQLFRDGVPRTRAGLVTETGQSRSTIAARIDALVSLGLLAPAGESTSTGGRPPSNFAFDPTARVVLGIDLGATHARLAVTDLAATVLAETSAPLAITDGPDPVLAWVAETSEKLVATAGRRVNEVVGLGLGLPGPVDHTRGRPVNPPIMPGWDDVDVPGRLHTYLPVPVLVDNDVNIMTLGEHRTTFPTEQDLLFVKVATGIGAGIVMDGLLRRGAQGAAGDIGHIAVPGADAVPCRCGNTGCLEALAGGHAIAARLRDAGTEAATAADVVALVRAGDVLAGQAVRQAGRDIGAVLASSVSLLNPARIVVGGVLAEAGEHLIAGIREVIYQRSLPLATQHLRITTSHTGGQAGVIGAAAMVTDQILAASAVEALIAERSEAS